MIDVANLTVDTELEIDFAYRHPYYQEMYANWVKNRDFASGSDHIKARTFSELYIFKDDSNFAGGLQSIDELEGTAYLPVPDQMRQDPKLYRDYRDRAQVYNASGMTVESYMGMLYRKNPIYQYESADADLEDEIKDKTLRKVTPDNKSFTDLCKIISREVIITNKVGILVDFPDTMSDRELSVLEYEELNLTPKASVYRAEKIINWHYTNVNDEVVPDYFVLDESDYGWNEEKACYEWIEKYRVLFLEDTNNDYIYHQMVVKKIDDKAKQNRKAKFVVEEFITPEKEGVVLNRLPFYVIDKDGLNFAKTEESIINDLVDVNMGHYRNSADWEHNLYFLGLKTLVAPGYDKDISGTLTVGGVISGPSTFQPYLIEPTSDSGIEKEMQNKEMRMAVLGSQAISQRGKYVQSAATAKINSASENSILAALAHAQSNVMSVILNLILEWAGHTGVKGNVNINTDFYDDLIVPESVISWTQLLQSGGISQETWYYNLEKRDVFPPDWSMAKELTSIEENHAPLMDDLLYRNTPLNKPTNDLSDIDLGNRKFEGRPDEDDTSDKEDTQQYGL